MYYTFNIVIKQMSTENGKSIEGFPSYRTMNMDGCCDNGCVINNIL